MQGSEAVEKWLGAVYSENQRQQHRATFESFLMFSGKTAQQIIAQYTEAPKKAKDYYGKLLLAYTSDLQRTRSPHEVKGEVDVVRSFFGFYGLPLGFGVRAHVQFFFK